MREHVEHSVWHRIPSLGLVHLRMHIATFMCVQKICCILGGLAHEWVVLWVEQEIAERTQKQRNRRPKVSGGAGLWGRRRAQYGSWICWAREWVRSWLWD